MTSTLVQKMNAKRSAIAALIVVAVVWQVSSGIGRYYYRKGWQAYSAGGGAHINREIDSEKLEVAAKNFAAAAKFKPLSSAPTRFQAGALMFSGQYEEAIPVIERSLRRPGMKLDELVYLAYVQKHLGMFDAMRETLKRAEKVDDYISDSINFSFFFGDVRNHPSMADFQRHYRD